MSSSATIKIDTNSGEDGLAGHIQSKATGSTFVVGRERLDVGDVRVTIATPDVAIDTLLFERKTWADLQSSLRDGRYKEQKARQMQAIAESNGRTRIIYLVELNRVLDWKSTGHPQFARGGVTTKQTDAAILMSSIRDGIPVIRTSGSEHTADVVLYLTKKAAANELDGNARAVEASAIGYAGLVKSSKKRANMDAGTTWQAMLATITGVSAKKARCIVDSYPTPSSLCAAYRTCTTDKETESLIADIQCGDRKIGKALSQRVASTIMGDGNKKAKPN